MILSSKVQVPGVVPGGGGGGDVKVSISSAHNYIRVLKIPNFTCFGAKYEDSKQHTV